LQRIQRKRNCEKERKNLEAINEKHYLCNPNEKGEARKGRRGGKGREKERFAGAKIRSRK
jgi:hypothetical protein